MNKLEALTKIYMGIKLPGLYEINQNKTTNKKEEIKCLKYTLLVADEVRFFLYSQVTSGTTIRVLINNSFNSDFLYSISILSGGNLSLLP